MGLAVPDDDDSPSPSPAPATSAPWPPADVTDPSAASRDPLTSPSGHQGVTSPRYLPGASARKSRRRTFDMASLLAPDDEEDQISEGGKIVDHLDDEQMGNGEDLRCEDEKRDDDSFHECNVP